MKAESLTENGWQMSVQSMSGTDVVNLKHAVKGEACTAEERQNTFTDMMKIALETAVRMDG